MIQRRPPKLQIESGLCTHASYGGQTHAPIFFLSFCSCISPWPLVLKKKEVVTACIAFLSDNRFSASAKSEPNFEIIYVLTEANGF
jgi:hypothetical protein